MLLERRACLPAVLALAGALLCLGGVGCGSSSQGASRRQPEGSLVRSYLNDQDQDIGGRAENSGYRDGDDGNVSIYGHAASRPSRKAISAVVERYFAAARAGNGSAGCAMLTASLARSAPRDFGEYGPSYLHGAKTCQALLGLVFGRHRRQLSDGVAVTGVLVDGRRAYALLGSASMPAGYIAVDREAGGWRIDALLAAGMP